MEKKTLQTEKGRIVYWTSGPNQSGGDKDDRIRIVFLPGLSADRRLFECGRYLKRKAAALAYLQGNLSEDMSLRRSCPGTKALSEDSSP